MKYILKIEQGFTDKYTDEEYKVGDEITVDEVRGKELLEDPRHLVSLVKKIDGEDDELETLKEKAKELGIKVTKRMSKEEIIAKIEEVENAKSENDKTDDESSEEVEK